MIVLSWLCVIVFENAFVYRRKNDKRKIITHIDGQYDNLLGLARERQNKLNETVKAYVLVREAAELHTIRRSSLSLFIFWRGFSPLLRI
ncbi:Alpha Spectrin [Operophtera brumata]|uniref:Alpha Spectrin n=1 Tax=Operophtera brumata TaxID=104452 RepID=A0A0L7KXP2_OPEBR|nr:Alpha Spectrin [Operophtera brumata]